MVRIGNMNATLMRGDKPLFHFVIERGEVTEYAFLYSKDDKDLVYEFWFYQTPERAILEFLDDRTVPETRQGLQHDMKCAGIPYYDPELILKFNHAACVTDDWWLQFDGQNFTWQEIYDGMMNNWGIDFFQENGIPCYL